MYHYPIPALDGSLTPEQVHQLLGNQRAIARQFKSVVQERFIADYLLSGRYPVVGGAVIYPETGESLYTIDETEEINAGGEYPLTVTDNGTYAAARTSKRGQDTEVYDETIASLGINPVNRALAKLGNTVIRDVDRAALAVIASKVTKTYASSAWSTGEAIVEALLLAKATNAVTADGAYEFDTAVLTPLQFAKVGAYLINGGFVPRENGDMIKLNIPVDALGMTWATTEHVPVADPMLVDRDQLGGMGDWDLKSPGYTRVGNVDTKVSRLGGEDDRDGYRVRARRNTVAVVVDANAAVRITGTGV